MSALAHCDIEGAFAQEERIGDTTPVRLTFRVWGVSQSRSVCIAVRREGWERTVGVDSVSHGAGGSEIGEELEAQADDEVPDVSGHLRTGDENAPDKNYQDGVESVANVPQPTGKEKWTKKTLHMIHLCI